MGYCFDRPDHIILGRIVEVLQTLIWKGHQCSEINELFCRNFEDKNVVSDEDDGGLTCESSEASKDYQNSLRDSLIMNL